MSKTNFVDKSLIHLKDRLAANAPMTEDVAPSENGTAQVAPRPVGPMTRRGEQRAAENMDREYRAALTARREEFRRVRSDVMMTISKSLATIPEQIEELEKRLGALTMARDTLEKTVEDIKAIDEDAWDPTDYAAALAEAGRKVENARLEYLTLAAKAPLEDAHGHNARGNQRAASTLVHEVISLSGRQWFRAGFYFFLPMGICLTGLTLFLILAILRSMGAL